MNLDTIQRKWRVRLLALLLAATFNAQAQAEPLKLRYGQSYSTLIDIARQASKDLGFKVEMSVTDHPGLTNRMIQDPNSIDIADSEIWQTKVYVPAGVTQAVDVKKIALWDKVTPLYKEGKFAGKEVSREGDSPYEYMYR
jgi:putative spermidine/putrescine transport system substrate-binding protein